VDLGDPSLFAFVRPHPTGPLLAVHNLTDAAHPLGGRVLETVGLIAVRDAIGGESGFRHDRPITMPPYAARWLTAEDRPART